MWWQILLLSLVCLLVACRIPSNFQYQLKMCVFYLCVCFMAIITLPVGLIRPFNPSNHKVLATVIPWLSSYLLGLTVEVRNREHAKSDKPFILLLNHQSSIDAFVMMYIWPERCVTIMKKELFYLPFFGLTSWLFGCIFLNRQNRDKALSTMAAAGKEMKERNVQICMFPEGTRNRDGHMLPFKKGAFHLAIEAQAPLVPAVISCYRNFYSKKRNVFKDGKVILTVLPPVSTTGKDATNITELSDNIRNDMVEIYDKTSAEVGADKFM